MRILDLFAGIGGFSLAAHWIGWETSAFVEWDNGCQKVLKKNFPNVPIYGDITQFDYEKEHDRIGAIDLICGGFPCQPFSSAGKRNGTSDDRYLWPEMLRTIREARPAWVVGENVAGLITMDGGAVFDEICTSLEDEGYTVEAFVIPACAVGAPHRRDRVWIVAHAGYLPRCPKQKQQSEKRIQEFKGNDGFPFAHPESSRWRMGIAPDIRQTEREKHPPGDTIGLHASDADQPGLEGYREHGERSRQCFAGPENWQEPWLQVATRLCRMDDGLPSWVDRHRTRRLKQLGNSIVPQVVYEIFRAIQILENGL